MSRTPPPPVRRIALDGEPTIVAPGHNGHRHAAPAGRTAEGASTYTGVAIGRTGSDRPASAPAGLATSAARSRTHAPAAQVVERMRIESVSLAYGQRWVVRDVTLPVRQGEVLALIGASGSGKTTLLRSLNRLTEVTAGASRAGSITLDGRGDRWDGGHRPAATYLDGLSAAESVPDEYLRECRLRAARGASREPAPARAPRTHASWSRR